MYAREGHERPKTRAKNLKDDGTRRDSLRTPRTGRRCDPKRSEGASPPKQNVHAAPPARLWYGRLSAHQIVGANSTRRSDFSASIDGFAGGAGANQGTAPRPRTPVIRDAGERTAFAEWRHSPNAPEKNAARVTQTTTVPPHGPSKQRDGCPEQKPRSPFGADERGSVLNIRGPHKRPVDAFNGPDSPHRRSRRCSRNSS